LSRTLPRSFYRRDSLELAPLLLNKLLVRTEPGHPLLAARIVEVEAYRGSEDPGSHAFRGRTKRTTTMFGPCGHLYVYFTYGMHWCANLVCGPPGRASAVLLRGGEVVTGVDLARSRRPAARRGVDLARGPARLASCLALTGADNGADLCAGSGSSLVVRAGPAGPAEVRRGPRVGVSGAGGVPAWRFWSDGEPTVSTYRPAVARRRASGV
jgi:DNA-3-methyladenine glycosylase